MRQNVYFSQESPQKMHLHYELGGERTRHELRPIACDILLNKKGVMKREREKTSVEKSEVRWGESTSSSVDGSSDRVLVRLI